MPKMKGPSAPHARPQVDNAFTAEDFNADESVALEDCLPPNRDPATRQQIADVLRVLFLARHHERPCLLYWSAQQLAEIIGDEAGDETYTVRWILATACDVLGLPDVPNDAFLAATGRRS